MRGGALAPNAPPGYGLVVWVGYYILIHLARTGFELTTLVVIDTDCIGSCKKKLPYDHGHDGSLKEIHLIYVQINSLYLYGRGISTCDTLPCFMKIMKFIEVF